MVKLSNAREIKENVSLVELLDKLGFKPAPRRGREKMYKSMLRDDDSTPSFSVNEKLGLWFDHGIHKGGNIIDFAMAYWKTSNISEAMDRIREALGEGFVPQAATTPKSRSKESSYQVDEVKNIGTHPAITSYLRSRGVFEIASNFLKEVYYHLNDNDNKKKVISRLAGKMKKAAGRFGTFTSKVQLDLKLSL